MDRVHNDYSTWAQEVGERFLLTQLSAGKFSCTKGRQSHKYLKGALWSVQHLLFALFSNTDISSAWNLCPDRLSSPTNNIVICVRVMQISRLGRACILKLLRNCTVFELFTLYCERIFTWVHDTYRGKVIVSTKFANFCKQSSIESGKCTVIISFPWISFPRIIPENNAFAYDD